MKWVDVNKKLPERSGRYLTHCMVSGQNLVAILFYDKINFGFDKEVTHWMPLPEYPNIKGGAE